MAVNLGPLDMSSFEGQIWRAPWLGGVQDSVYPCGLVSYCASPCIRLRQTCWKARLYIYIHTHTYIYIIYIISFKPYLINQLAMIFGLVLSFPSHFAWINPSIFHGLERNHAMTIPMKFSEPSHPSGLKNPMAAMASPVIVDSLVIPSGNLLHNYG